MLKTMSEIQALMRKKGFILWSKNGEEEALLTNQPLHSRGWWGYSYRDNGGHR
jgi:hypothetical protein